MTRADIVKERRLQRVRISAERLYDILAGRVRLIFPTPVEIVGAAEERDYPQSSFAIFVGAEEFEPVAANVLVPSTPNYLFEAEPAREALIAGAADEIWWKYGTGIDAQLPPKKIEEAQREQLRVILRRHFDPQGGPADGRQ